MSRHLRRALPSSISSLLALSLIGPSSLEAYPITAVDLVAGLEGTEAADVLPVTVSVAAPAVASAEQLDFVALLGGGDVDASSTALARSAGVDGRAGDDTVTVVPPAGVTGTATAQAKGALVGGSLLGSAAVNVGVDATAVATGLDGGADADRVSAATTGTTADARARGVSLALAVDGTLVGSDATAGSAVVQAATQSAAQAVALQGGAGGDTLLGNGSLSATAGAHTTAVAAGISVGVGVGGDVAAAAGLSDASGRAEASATGLAGGEGADTLRTEGGRVDLSADAGTAAVGVSLGISGSVSGDAATAPPVSRSGATAAARVTGLSGGAGDDVVVSGQPVTGSARSDATAVGVSVGVTVAKGGAVSGGALSNAAVTALSGATGIDGGDGNDVLGGTGALTLTARSDATAVGVGVAIAGTVAVGGTADGGVAGTALSDSQATAEASAVGVEGGGGADTIDNGGVITAGAVAHATAVAVTVAGDVNVGIDVTPDGDVSGAALSDARVGSAAATTGIAGGAEGDGITNRGALSLTSEARSTGVAVGLTLAGNVAYKPPADEGAAPPAGDEDDDSAPKVGGRALGNAATTAQATTRGLAGEAGDDTLLDVATGTLRLLHATADAIGVAASVNLSAGVGVGTDAKIDVSGAAVSDVRVTAEAVAAALEGGAGKDTVTNQAEVTDLRADATATGVAAALTISGSLAYKGDAAGKLAGEAMSKASTLAAARAVVLGGGSGDDVLLNEAVLRSVVAHADATGVSAALGVTAGLAIDGSAKDVEVSGRAVGDVGVAATATAIGLDGGTGRDTITNRGSIPALLAESEATGVSVAVNIAGTLAYKGEADSAVAGEAVSTSTASADSLALGIAAGDGGGDILNTASLGSVRATATATSVGVGLAISGQVAYAEKKDDGAGEDDGASGEDAAAGDGKEIKGRVVSDARALATALAGGIGGGDGVDVVDNRGAIAATALADAKAVAVSVAGSVNVGIDVAPAGDVSGAALSDARVQGTAIAVGIDGAGAADGITNRAALSVKSDAKATGVAVGLTIAGNVSYEKSEDGAGDDAAPEPSDEDEGAGSAGKVSGDALSRASTTAIATTAGILGGDGNDTIVNEIAGVLPLLDAANALARATGVAATLNLAAGVAVGSDAKLDVTGAAVSDVSVRADALATAIDGGAGDDAITNRAALARLWADATATGVAAALNVSGSLAYEGAVSGKLAGEAVSDAQTLATARTVAFGGADGNDTVTNEAALGEIKATSRAVGVAAALGVSAGLAIKGDAKDVEVSGRAVSDASVTASATAIAIEGGAGGDTLDNEGAIAAVLAESHATGVAASLNVAGSLSYKGDTDANVAGQAVSDTSVTSTARAAAMTGGDGADHLTNGATLSSVVSRADAVGVAAALGVAVSVTVEGDATAKVDGGALSKGTVTADAATTGLDGGAGDDVIVNTGAMPWLESAADTVGVAAGLGVSAVVTVKGDTTADVTGKTLSDTSARAQATTTALSGGDGVDRIENSGALNLLAGADATGIAASLNVSAAVTFKGTQEADVGGNAASNASVTAFATATGIDGGAGNDTVVNDGAITVMRGADVDAYALGVAAALNVSGSLTIKGVSTGGDVAGTAASDARVAAQALATGIGGGDGADDITNRAPVVLLPAAEALGVSGSLNVSFNLTGESSGGAFSVADVTALAGATGVAGGAGDDVVLNSGRLELMKQALGESPIDAKALAVSVSLNLSGTLNGDAMGKAIATATTTADAAAVGIDGGSGADRLTNSGAIVADVGAEADAVSVAASITVTGATGGHSEGAALTDARALARAAATGIHGGDGGDTLVNTGALDLTSGADAAATAVSVNLSGGLVGKATGTALADGSAHAASRSVGIDGGAGADGIASSLQPVTVHALSSADSQSVAVSIAGAIGLAHGAAVADASASSDAYAAALDGGAGADTIDNASVLAATAGAAAIAKSTSVGVTFGVGTAENVGTGNSSATARATATGIEGGDDGDTITNRAAITVGGAGALPMANATSGSTTVGVTVALGASKGSMSSDSAARALAGAYGISGGAGADHIDNSGAITAGRKPPDDLGSLMARATAGSDTVNVALGAGGSFQDAAANASALATTTVAGLAGGAGTDTIDNRGAIEAYASAGAFSGGAATKASLTLGTSGGGASSDASSVSTAFAAGIDSGADADEVHLMGNLTVGSWSLSSASSTARDYNILSIGAALQSALADSSSSATAVAQGIYGGTGRDLLSLGDPLAAGAYRIDVDALSSVASTSRASSVAGLTGGSVEQQARSAAETVSHALAVGVDGGEGNDGIVSAAKITADATAGASTTGVSSTNTGVSIGGANRGESMSDARATVTAEGVGIRGGVAALAAGETDRDTIVNAAPVAVTATASGSSESTATAKGPVTIAGSAAGRAVADASAEVLARAVGVDGGADDDVIETRAGPSVSGTIDATANASTTVKATSRANEAVGFGSASSMGVSDASASVATLAVGIDAGAGDDVVRTRTRVATTSEASGNITATSDVTAHVAFGAGSTGAVSDSSASKRSIAVGIDAGSGADLVENTGEITGSAVSGGTVASSSSARTGAFFGRAASNAVSSASLEGATDATGVRGGEGGDTLRNYGTVRATADSTLTVTSLSVATAKSTFSGATAATDAAADAVGSAVSLGIGGDGGNDVVENAGVLDATGSATTSIRLASIAIASSTFGSTSTLATSRSVGAASVSARGIAGGDGDDNVTVADTGRVTVKADADLTLTQLTVSSAGRAYADARARAIAVALGVEGGDGADRLVNLGDVQVYALPRVLAATRSAGGSVEGDVGVRLDADARGLDGGAGDDLITNAGDVTVLVGALHWAPVLPAGTPDIAVTAVNLGGYVNADASALADVHAAGIAGGDGWDAVLNDALGVVRVAASNFLRMATVEVGASVRAVLRTSSQVRVEGIAGEDVDNCGRVEADGAARLTADGATLTIYGLSVDQTGTAAATTRGVQGDAVRGGTFDNFGTVLARSSAEVRSVERVTALFASGEQKLQFAAASTAAGVSAGAGDDTVHNDDGGDVDVSATASGSIQGVTTTFNLFGLGGRTVNLVDARLDATALGLDLGAGSNVAENLGTIAVRASARPADPSVAVAQAVSDVRYRETSATATAASTAVARGVQGVGDDTVTNRGGVEVVASAEATSFAQAGVVTAAQDQSSITSISGVADNQFVDESLRGLADGDVVGKRLRFPKALGLDFLAESSTVTARDVAASAVDSVSGAKFVDTSFATTYPGVSPVGMRIRFDGVSGSPVLLVTGFNSTTGEFTLDASVPSGVKADTAYALQVPTRFFDTGFAAASPGVDPVGMRIRFPVTGGDFLSVVTAYDRTTGAFTVRDAVPTAVGTSSGFTLSVLTSAVTAFDSATGKVTLGNDLPDGIGKGDTYTFSVVSAVGGTYSFTDATRDGDSIPLNTRVTFPSVPGFSATVTGFAAGVFTLDRPVPVGIAADDVYALAVDESDERAGADAQGYATGVDLSGAHVRLVNAGTLEVEAVARADTAVVAVVATASAAGVAEARGLRTGVGDDQVENTGSITVGATVATTASTGAVDQRALAVGIDTGGGDDLVINRGDITVSGAVGAAGSSGTSGVDVVGIRTGAGNDTVLAAGNITATITAGAGTALAISTEDGNDHVSLLAGLRTAQDVALGAGDDTLLLAAGAAFTGTARADPGRDTFVLGGDADGSFAMAEVGDAARYRGFDVYRKQGRSTWTLTGDAAMDWVVDEGVLALRDTLTGTLATSAGSPGGVAEVLAGARLRGPDGVAPVLLDGAGGLVNYGWIEGVGATGDQVGIRIVGSGNTLFNAGAGTILARADGAGRAAGILLQGSGALAVNEGLVQAEGASGSAVVLSGAGNVLLNRGRLTSFDAAARFEGLAGAANMLLNDVGGTVESTGAMPVAGGPGNDTLENHGRIVGPTARLIDLGAGDDRLLIGASSVIDGTADGGTGADTFVLGGRVDAAFDLGQIGTKYTGFELFRKEGASRWSVTGTADGPWNVGGGTLSVNGTLAGPVVVEAPGRLGGNGTVGSLVNYGTVAPGNSIGVVTVAGDYTHAAGAVLEIEVEGLRSDRLDVGGRATLEGGAVKVVPAGRFGIATEYTILTAAGGISGAFDSAFATAGFLDADLDYAADRVLLTVIRNDFSFASFARTYNQRAVGLALDADKKAAARGDFKTVIDEFLTLAPEQVGGALDALSGELHATTQGVLMRSGDWFLATAVDRAARLQQVQEEGRTVWLDVYGGLGSFDGDGNASAADYRASGLALGVDYAVDPATRLGAAFGYSSSTTNLDRTGAGEADADTYHLALYGEYADGPWDLRGAATYSRHSVEATRHIAYGSVARVAEADYDANQYTLYLRGGYDLPGPALSTLQPYVSLAYSRLDRPDFNETGAGSLDLRVEDETTESLVSVLGLRARWDQEWGKARVQPELRVGWAHQFLDDYDVMSANLAGAPSALGYQGFTVRSPATGRDSLVLGAALTAEVGKSTRLFLSYDGVMNGDQADHAFVGGVRVEW